MMHDVIILGGGPAGYLAAERAGGAGMNVALVEKRNLGGVCLNEGCVPSKTILHSSKLYSHALHAQKYGVSAKEVSFDLATVMQRKNKIIQALRKGIGTTMKKFKVTVEGGEGRILPKKGDDFQVQVGDKILAGKKLLITTGSEAIRIPVPGADQDFVYTNREILDIDFIPQNFVVIGGGVIGLEIATFFAEVGSKVTVVELLPAIAGPIDSEISGILQKELAKKGITFKLNCKVTAIGDKLVTYEADGKAESVSADIVLMSVGRRPLTKDIGLENLNVYIERGAIAVDEHGRTSIPNVWAAGDVNGTSMLAHTAYREGEVCINDMLGKPDIMRYNAIPGVIYTHPEVATVGYSESEAIDKGHQVASAKLPLSYNGRYLAETEGGRGICKVVIDKTYGTLLGVHIIGSACSEMIYGAAAMIEAELRVEDIKEIVFPHPTVSEIIKDTLRHAKT
ncbi:MAG: dihydrolipoyl dehydrogenase [Chitinivibrionales bacterium]|nr:dihydrolipoyl dehydrogenase [Chitinivibrionales bacterium]